MTDTRLSKVKKLLRENSLDTTLISSVPNIIYLTGFDHFYSVEREGFLLITKKNNYIFTDKRYTAAVKKHVKNFILCEIAYMQGFEDWIKKLTKEEKIQTLGIEENNITVSEEKKLIPYVKELKPFNLSSLRIKKSPDELESIKKACEIGDKTFSYICKKFKVGITEKEISFLMESFIKNLGAETSFETIVAFEENAAFIHHKTGTKKLEKNNMILLDFGVKYQNYCSDMTRTISFGKANKEQKKVYETVLAAQQKAIEQFNNLAITQSKPVPASAMDKVARSYIIDQGYPSFPHSLGHGIGLQVHEAPYLSPKSEYLLTEGMVFSIEPGIYLDDEFGVRIEDLFAIENGKLVRLTKSPRNFIEI